MAEVYRWRVIGGNADYRAVGATVIFTASATGTNKRTYVKSAIFHSNAKNLAAGNFDILAKISGALRVVGRGDKDNGVVVTDLLLDGNDEIQVEVEVIADVAGSIISSAISIVERDDQPA